MLLILNGGGALSHSARFSYDEKKREPHQILRDNTFIKLALSNVERIEHKFISSGSLDV